MNYFSTWNLKLCSFFFYDFNNDSYKFNPILFFMKSNNSSKTKKDLAFNASCRKLNENYQEEKLKFHIFC